MFKVPAESLEEYLAFDPARTGDLKQLDALIRKAAPSLKRYFHAGTPAGQIGMRFKMIGYGQTRYSVKSGESTVWPVIGAALQKNYISVYFAVDKEGAPIVDSYKGKLGELRTGQNNFSFERFDDLNAEALSSLIAEAAGIFYSRPDGPA
jgi:Domain of unknown function (DU1801)